MSSTNRGYNRHKSDYYVTPKDEIKEFLKYFILDTEISLLEKTILDPCAGGDKENEMSYPSVLTNYFEVPKEKVLTMDIREDSRADIKQDYINFDIQIKPDIIITNPPFYIAQEVINKALKDIKENGIVIMLLRLNFLGSQKRRNWWHTNMPNLCYVHPKRMSFIPGTRKTDSIEYAHFIWFGAGNQEKYCKLRLL